MTIQEYLQKTIQHLGIDENLSIQVSEGDERIEISIEVPEKQAALLIGNRGENMEALELLTKLAFKKDFEGKRILLDVNHYRQQMMEKLKEKALEVAERVLETKRPFEFRNLNSFERYQIHSAIAEDERFQELTTFSEDRDDRRVLLIAPKSMVEEVEENPETL